MSAASPAFNAIQVIFFEEDGNGIPRELSSYRTTQEVQGLRQTPTMSEIKRKASTKQRALAKGANLWIVIRTNRVTEFHKEPHSQRWQNGAPGWMDDERYDAQARTPQNAEGEGAPAPPTGKVTETGGAFAF